MPIAFRGQAFGGAINGGNVTLTLASPNNGSAPVVNDVVLIISSAFPRAGNEGRIGNALGYTQIEDNSTSGQRVRFAWKKFVAGETGPVIEGSGNAADATGATAIWFSGVDPVNPFALEQGTNNIDNGVATSGINPDAPAFIPSKNNCMMVVLVGDSSSDAAAGTVTSYTTFATTQGTSDTNSASTAVAYRLLVGGAGVSQDPAAFNAWTTGAYLALTTALQEIPPIRQQYWPLPTQPRAVDEGFTGPDLLQTTLSSTVRPFIQLDWPLPNPLSYRDRYREWMQSTSIILRGLNTTMPVRISWPAPPRVIWYRTWELNLLQTTLQPAAAAPFSQDDWPLPPRPPLQPALSWTWQYNLNLIGQDRLPTGEQTTELVPRAPLRSAPSWTWQYNLNLIAQDQMVTGEQSWELPPRAPLRSRDLLTWIQQVNLSLATAPPDLYAQARQQDWPIPRGAEPSWRRTWEWWYNQNLIGQDQLPIRQQDWPLGRGAEPNYRRDWEQWYNLNLIGQDQLPVGEQTWELSPRAPLRGQDLLTWIQSVNLSLTTAPPNIFAQARQQDWPVPRGPEPNWRRGWEWSYNLNLIGQDKLPFRQQDWPNPLGAAAQRAADISTWIDRVKLTLLVPVGDISTDLPPRDYGRVPQTWIQGLNLSITAVPPSGPFNQYDWALPLASRQPTRSWAASYNLNLIGRDQLPNRQQHWPLPAAHTTPILLQIWAFGRVLLYPTPVFPPGDQFFDRPQLRRDTPADSYFIGERYLIIPSVIGASYRLLSSHYLYGIFYIPNSIVTEGHEIPFGWVPTLAVDPLNVQAVAAFYAAGPRNNAYEDMNTYDTMYRSFNPFIPVSAGVTHWVQVPGTSLYQLTGLGAGNPPIGSD